MNRSMTAAVYGPGARTAQSVQRSQDRIDLRRDSAEKRRAAGYAQAIAALHVQAQSYSLRDIFAARARA